jgi:hypothetical protein
MSQVSVEVKIEPKDILVEFFKGIEREYKLEDTISLAQSKKRKIERKIIKEQLKKRDKEVRELRSLKTKMLKLQANFDPKVLEELNKIRDTINNDPRIQKLKSEISTLKAEKKKLHEDNRIAYFNEKGGLKKLFNVPDIEVKEREEIENITV